MLVVLAHQAKATMAATRAHLAHLSRQVAAVVKAQLGQRQGQQLLAVTAARELLIALPAQASTTLAVAAEAFIQLAGRLEQAARVVAATAGQMLLELPVRQIPAVVVAVAAMLSMAALAVPVSLS